jgi:hypothetical protein
MKRTVIDRILDTLLTFVAATLLMHALSAGTVEVPVQNPLQPLAQPADEGPSFEPFA